MFYWIDIITFLNNFSYGLFWADVKMEAFEAAKIVYNRILETESETITRKIIGYIYLQDHADREMIRLAFGPDNLIQTLIQKAKMDLNLSPKPVPSPFGPILHSHRPFSAPQMLHHPNMIHDHFIGLNDHFEPLSPNMTYSENCYSPDGNFRTRKICHYFNKGHCKHGNSCKFIHSQSMSDFNYEIEDQAAFSPGSLEKLEFEITEILKSRRGNPISIASLPMIYYERYGRTLQAEGYLTESQRHGKAGYSLTRLLARLRNSIRLIDRFIFLHFYEVILFICFIGFYTFIMVLSKICDGFKLQTSWATCGSIG